MSLLLVQSYLSDIDRLRKFSGVTNEQVIRPAFRRLLESWSISNHLVFLEEFPFNTALRTIVYPDGTILHDLRVPLGYWEAKDTNDDLAEEIRKKIARGYPQDNIIYENSEIAVLIQNRSEVMRCRMTETDDLLKLLTIFFSYERKEIAEFRRAVQQFKTDLPTVLEALRKKISEAYSNNRNFAQAANRFLNHARSTINPSIGEADVREMLIQHILTEEIFANVFDNRDFHRENNIAKELYALEAQFFTGSLKRETLHSLEPYYATIRSNAALISRHAEKQTFLKVIYENFYRVYDTKKADRLGVVYTPNEIVRFMIDGADWLCHREFGKGLLDRGVEILDPATGTGTFICELIERFRGQPKLLTQKYKNELHANEVAILPYYVANLNIEATYAAITDEFIDFQNLCFVDTLDNVAGLGIRAGQQLDILAGLSDENIERVRRQNGRKISVIIGNPPYNANQANENDNNKNREYKRIDKEIKGTYIKLSKAQKSKVYDMYARFFRWATDRVHDDGIIAFVTNRSFIESRTFDGFRKSVLKEFNEIYLLDLGGDVRANPKLSGTKHNVFGIQTGVAISFFLKKHRAKGCEVFYARRPEFETASDKLAFLGSTKASAIQFDKVTPDKSGNWINLTDNDWDNLLPLADKATKSAKTPTRERALFKLFSLGVASNRDEWAFDFDREALRRKENYFKKTYSKHLSAPDSFTFADFDKTIKWTSELEKSARRGVKYEVSASSIGECSYRPFVTKWINYNALMIHRFYAQKSFFPSAKRGENLAINFYSLSSNKSISVLASDRVCDLGFLKQGNGGTFSLARYRYDTKAGRHDNITDWGLKQFEKHYGSRIGKITKDMIFQYVYAVLHDPKYRETYAQNLRRELPRIPFYKDFHHWVGIGKKLLSLHVGFDKAKEWPLRRSNACSTSSKARVALKANRKEGAIQIDSVTTLSDVPDEAWEYKLANRSALEWMLDQYRGREAGVSIRRSHFPQHDFAELKEEAISALRRVTTVSAETVKILKTLE